LSSHPNSPAADWMKLAHDGWSLWAESLTVMSLRTADLMSGRGSNRENALMVSEKVAAAAEVAMMLATAGIATPHATASKAMRYYRRKVRANRRRLSDRKR